MTGFYYFQKKSLNVVKIHLKLQLIKCMIATILQLVFTNCNYPLSSLVLVIAHPGI